MLQSVLIDTLGMVEAILADGRLREDEQIAIDADLQTLVMGRLGKVKTHEEEPLRQEVVVIVQCMIDSAGIHHQSTDGIVVRLASQVPGRVERLFSPATLAREHQRETLVEIGVAQTALVAN